MRALCLSGGGSKGIFQVGVISSLLQNDKLLDYDLVCGVSAGALNAAGLLKFTDIRNSAEWLQDLWMNRVEVNSVYTQRSWFNIAKFRWHKPVYNSAPLRTLVENNIKSSELISSGKKLAVGACCLDTGEYHYVDEKTENIHDWIVASASYPMFMDPVVIDGKLWADGQIKHVTPMRQAIKMGATELDVILCSNFETAHWNSPSKLSIPDQFVRMIDLMSSEIMQADVKFLKLKNWMVDTAVVTDIPYKKITARIIMPKNELIVNSLNFSKHEIKRMFAVGSDLDNSIIINL